MRKHFTKRRVILLSVVVIALALGAGAFAYFTATGSGNGTANVGSATSITLTPTITGTLYPNGSPASVSIVAKNTGSGAQFVNSVHLASITADGSHPSCVTTVATSGSSTAFTMADVSVNTDLAPNGTVTKTGSLQMNDTGISQDGCQGATLTLNFTSN